jgi:hypothetical protein
VSVHERPTIAAGRIRHEYIVLLNEGRATRLRSSVDLWMSVQQVIAIEQSVGDRAWTGQLVSYAYTFGVRDDREVLAFHWHAEGASLVTHPHVHIGSIMIAANASVRPSDFHRAHIPTGTVLFEDIARFAVAELDVEPLRADWESVLAGIARRRQQVP